VEEQVKAVENALLSFVWFSPEEFNKINATALKNEEIGEITRSYAIASRLIRQSFRELDKLKKVKVNNPPDINPAR
jgi:hypothetical protein